MKMKFELNSKEQEAFDKFVKRNKNKNKDKIIEITFSLTGIGTSIKVRKGDIEKNITDYTSW